jgi:hypothetical protein
MIIHGGQGEMIHFSNFADDRQSEKISDRSVKAIFVGGKNFGRVLMDVVPPDVWCTGRFLCAMMFVIEECPPAEESSMALDKKRIQSHLMSETFLGGREVILLGGREVPMHIM